MFGIGGWELLLIFLIILLVFGAKRLPEIARSMGKATNEFKKAKHELANMANDASNDVTSDSPPANPHAPEHDKAKS